MCSLTSISALYWLPDVLTAQTGVFALECTKASLEGTRTTSITFINSPVGCINKSVDHKVVCASSQMFVPSHQCMNINSSYLHSKG